jgi:copper homeostasis protein
MMTLEVCVDSVESSIAAAKGGAERVELCSALSEGGITPSAGLIGRVRELIGIQLFVIIRPRGGNFVYSEPELDVMRRDIALAKVQGVDGVVLGALNSDNSVNRQQTSELIELARPMQVTFHRAFDACADFDQALEDVIACRADRVLTAGGESDAVNNLDVLARLQCRAAGRIRIMAGGGVRIGNVREIALRTGISEVHTSLSPKTSSASRDAAGDGKFDPESAYCVVKEADVQAFKAELQKLTARS